MSDDGVGRSNPPSDTSSDHGSGVLAGVRVVEVSTWAMVPAAGAILAEWGADVIKVEGPTGDPVRGLVTAGIDPTGPRYTWEMWNRGKQGLALDLKEPRARQILRELVERADVFLTNVLPGQREALGVDEAAVRDANPTIVYGSGSGYGPSGPDADKGGYDAITFWARGGAASSVTPPGGGLVGMPAGAFGDALSGMALAGGVAAALARRARTGEGALVEGALLPTALWAMQMSITGAHASGLESMVVPTRQRPYNPLVNSYLTSDGRWIQLCMMQSDRFWPGLCAALERHDLVHDPRFADASARAENVEACVAELDTTFATRSLTQWRPRLAGQTGQWDVAQNVAEVLRDPQVTANRFVHHVDYGDGHELALVGAPVRFDRTPPPARRAPEFAGDTDAILEELGWDAEAILDARIIGAVF